MENESRSYLLHVWYVWKQLKMNFHDHTVKCQATSGIVCIIPVSFASLVIVQVCNSGKSWTELDCRVAVIATVIVVMLFLVAVIFTTTEEALASPP